MQAARYLLHHPAGLLGNVSSLFFYDSTPLERAKAVGQVRRRGDEGKSRARALERRTEVRAGRRVEAKAHMSALAHTFLAND
jgi:hypothetical protein